MRQACQHQWHRQLAARLTGCPQPRRHHPRKLIARKAATALFTGIVQGTATVLEATSFPGFRQLKIQLPQQSAHNVPIGGSIAINGTCLTVTGADVATGVVSFDVISETLRATNLGELQTGGLVNFERSARMGDEIGGHNVAGHVHTTALIHNMEETPNNVRITFQVPEEWVKYIFPKGYIAVDGISLTVGEVQDNTFCVYLIPETLRMTILGSRQPGQSVNLEIDTQTQTIVDTVEKVVGSYLQRQGLASSVAVAV